MKTRKANSEKDLEIAKRIDDLAFGEHQGISKVELREIFINGTVLLLENDKGRIVGQSQILFSSIGHLPYTFPDSAAYCYGTGILPEFQKRGFGRLLAMAQEEEALKQNKKELHLSVRLENYASIKMRISLGFRIIDYIADFYSFDETIGARVIMVKSLENSTKPLMITQEFLSVDFNSGYNSNTHSEAQKLLRDGYQGVSIDKQGITFVHF